MKAVTTLAVGFLVAVFFAFVSPESSRAAPAGPMTALPEISSPVAAQNVHYRRYHHCHTRYKKVCRWVRHHYKKVYRCYSRPHRYCHGYRSHYRYKKRYH